LSLALVAGAFAGVLLLSWEVAGLRSARDGEARLLASVVAGQGHALHHWLHGARAAPGFAAPAQDAARLLTAVERTDLRSHPAWPVAGAPRGWTLTPWIAVTGGQTGDALPQGLLVLVPDAGAEASWIDRARNAVADASADELASALAPAPGYDPARDIAVNAWAYSGLSDRAVLRDRRPGHPDPRLVADLDLDGNRVAAVEDLVATNDLEGASLSAGVFRTGGTFGARTLTAQAAFRARGRARAPNATAGGALTARGGGGIETMTAGPLRVTGAFVSGGGVQ